MSIYSQDVTIVFENKLFYVRFLPHVLWFGVFDQREQRLVTHFGYGVLRSPDRAKKLAIKYAEAMEKLVLGE